jgi:hypothetical protein
MIGDIERILSDELLAGETVLWVGQPNPKKLFNKADIYLVPFSVFWCGIALTGVVTMFWNADLFGAVIGLLFGMPFVAAGLYFAVGRFIYKTAVKKHTVYAITTLRVMCLTLNAAGEKKKRISSEISTIQNESLSLGNDGCGSLFFGAMPYYSCMYMNTGLEFFNGWRENNTLAFFDVDNAAKVFEIYKKARYSARV